MRKVWVGVLAAGAFLVGAGTAVGTVDWHGMPELNSSGVRFRGGEYRFNPAGQNHGAFEWKGKLKDADAEDGHNVYVLVRVEGHSWVRYNGKQGKTVHLHHSNWDGAQRYTNQADIRACRNRGSLHPDNCSVTKSYSNGS
ncbi:hypothetical protein SAMN04487983_105250 [Streptomyces sp. yr375]|uniref:hypothetical protein n=1 Tax=Streptomyces sp. yr375 TaxID=1761906 RepID=UPI0008D56D0A|nr:hypothetical protein [Streptomyces sp. yr375]SES42525.1 hypothetical protein SAMN04487983_105250 [Streptomyces sp. yr375]